LDDVRKDESRIFGEITKNIPGIDMHEQQQLDLLEQFLPFYQDMPFGPGKRDGLRFFFDNPAYSYSDAIFLHCMIRSLKPKRIMEVGSGYSSCMTLDTNDMFFDGCIETTFIEPYPELLRTLIADSDQRNIRIMPTRLQEVDVREFENLQANDILFIDSTHVSKINSDVNYVFFDLLPRLASGVRIHFHDIFYPFEYPKAWVYEGRAWNEMYVLRTFLQYNSQFSIVLMNTFLSHFHESFFRTKMPLCLKNTGGSIWLRKH
ncbi:MAG: class I SAM-dependent methyltransferase, partial [Ferrovibrio sp.]|uniref:class I SAM-dependent methyltransferase n=1 Tax=Ferrovibrio sp. TaxID=1917215 RepID=UPI0026071489